MTSSISGLYRLTLEERRERIRRATGLDADALGRLEPDDGLSGAQADRMVENALGVFGLPFGVCVNMQIDGRDVLAPMVVEDFSSEIGSFAAHASSQHVACALQEGLISIRDLSTGHEQFRIESKDRIRLLGFAGDQELLVGFPTGGREILAWRRSQDEWRLHWQSSLPGDPLCGSLSSNGRFVVVGYQMSPGKSRFRVFDAEDGTQIVDVEVRGQLQVIAIGPNAELVAYNRGSSRFHIWSTKAKKLVASIDAKQSGVWTLEFSRAGEMIACGCDDGIAVYSTSLLELVGSARGHKVLSIAFAPDNQTVLYSSIQSNSVRLWNVLTNRDVRTILLSERPSSVGFARDGTYLVVSGRGSFRSWPLRTAERLELSGHTGGVPGVTFSPDDRLLASIGKDGITKLHDVATGNVERVMNTHGGGGQSISFMKHGRILATGGWTPGNVRIWNADSGTQVHNLEHECGVKIAVTFDRTGRYLAVAGTRGVEVWTIADRQPGESLAIGRYGRISSRASGYVRFSSSGDLLAWSEFNRGDSHGSAHVWDLAARSEVFSPSRSLHRPFQCLSFFPDDQRLVFIDDEYMAEIWDVRSATLKTSFNAAAAPLEDGAIYSSHLALSPDGDRLATSSRLGEGVNIWAAETGRLEFSLPDGDGTVWFLAWSSDSDRLAVSRASGKVAIWDLSRIDQELSELGLQW